MTELMMPLLDPTTQSNYTQVATENVALDWTVDFETNTISGSATHTLKVKEDGPKEVMYVSTPYTERQASTDSRANRGV